MEPSGDGMVDSGAGGLSADCSPDEGEDINGCSTPLMAIVGAAFDAELGMVITGLPPDIENREVVESLEVREPGRKGLDEGKADTCLGIDPESDPELGGCAGGDAAIVGKGDVSLRGLSGTVTAVDPASRLVSLSACSDSLSAAGGDVGGACASSRDRDDGLVLGEELSRVRTEKACEPEGWNVSSIIASGGLAGIVATSKDAIVSIGFVSVFSLSRVCSSDFRLEDLRLVDNPGWVQSSTSSM